MGHKIFAPFTDKQVEQLNRYQQSNFFHPFTCGGDRTDESHLDGEGVLVAENSGWKCPYCPYRQDWAHSFMANKNWLDEMAQVANRIDRIVETQNG